ncbi:Hypothetical_protein [Hexamita inflata]|uniref:Hypothetical_protein n=1 Tax=Hexamita inflata TaxID=28002 RepID=A0AA86Q2U3_9EUKA|nr:Hypothetical protein HINF_LOCUS36188 [Hexamita inflata]
MNKCQSTCPGNLPITSGKMCVNVCPGDKPYLDGTECKATCASLSYIQNTGQAQQLICQASCSGYYYVNGTQKRCVSFCEGFYVKFECVVGGCNSTYPIVSVNECRANCSSFSICNQAKTFNNKLLLFCDGDQYSASNSYQSHCLQYSVPVKKFDNTIKTVFLYQKRVQNANINIFIAKESVSGYEIYLIAKQDTLQIIESRISFSVETNSILKFSLIQKASSLKVAGCIVYVSGEGKKSSGLVLEQTLSLQVSRTTFTTFTKGDTTGGLCSTIRGTILIEDLNLIVTAHGAVVGGLFAQSQVLNISLNKVSIIGQIVGAKAGIVAGTAVAGTVITGTKVTTGLTSTVNVCGSNGCTTTGF